MKDIGIGIYGANGHQIHGSIANTKNCTLRGVAGFEPEKLASAGLDAHPAVKYDSLDQMLKDPAIQLVSLCSPKRSNQASDAIKALNAGKHVYAEKPCAMTEAELDSILEAADKNRMRFFEMTGTAFSEPYLTMRSLVKSGIIGEVVQVFVQKSYPLHDRRPQDENVDGGLLMQAGVHATRYIEHVAGTRIKDVYAIETTLGNPVEGGGLKMAASLMMRLENSGVAAMIVNYLNQPGFGSWGNESLRIFGTKGFMEAVDAGKRTRLVVGGNDMGEIKTSGPGLNYLQLFINNLVNNEPMPLSLEEELHPTRIVIRAKAAVKDI